jgi:hypothetical protein
MTAEPKARIQFARGWYNVDEVAWWYSGDRAAWFLPHPTLLKGGKAIVARDGRARERLGKAIKLLDPPAGEGGKWRKQVREMLELLEEEKLAANDELQVGLSSTQGKSALARYIRALREVQASYAALNPSIQQFLALKRSIIKHDLDEAGEMMKSGGPRPHKRPANKRARFAVRLARCLLEQRGCKLTTRRVGKWHTLSQILADTRRDLRHHLSASLAEKL